MNESQVAPSFFSNTWQIAVCALDNMAAILTIPAPEPCDQTPEAQLVRALMLAVAEVPLAHARLALGTVH